MQLKGGFTTEDPRLDRIPEFDEQSRRFSIVRTFEATYEPVPNTVRSYTWRPGNPLDQGREGACVGFSRAHCNACRPIVHPDQTTEEALRLYYRSRELDAWPGEDYDGTSVIAGAKAAREKGYLKSFFWGFTLHDFCVGVGYRYPAVVGIDWHTGMFTPDQGGWIAPTGPVAGGHAILIYGIKIAWKPDAPKIAMNDVEIYDRVDVNASYVKFQNSWGPDWGIGGTARMTLAGFDQLRKANGEVCFAHEVKL